MLQYENIDLPLQIAQFCGKMFGETETINKRQSVGFAVFACLLEMNLTQLQS